MKSNLMKIGAFVVIVILGLSGMMWLGSTEKVSNRKPPREDVRAVNIETIEYGKHTLQVAANGVIESTRTLDIVAEASGRVVYAKNDLKDGTFVEKGEVILQIDQREAKNNLLTYRSDFLNSVATVLPEMKIENDKIYKKWLNYFNNINIKEDLPVLPEIETSQEQIKLSTRNVFTKYYNVKNQEIFLSKHLFMAPFDGFINSNGILENSYVSRGQKLFVFSDVVNLEIEVPLLIDEFNHIDANNAIVKIHSPKSDEILMGKITRRDTKLEKNSQSLSVFVTFNNRNLNPNFLPGNYVDLSIQGQKLENVALVPRHCVDNNHNIYVMEDGKLSRKKVNLIAIEGQKAVIDNSVPNQTKLVTTILQKPLIGMKIKDIQEVVAERKKKEAEENDENKFAMLQ